MVEQLEELKKVLQKEPKNSLLLKKLGDFYLKNGFYKQAKEQYELAVLFSPYVISEIMLEHEKHIEKEPFNTQLRLSLVSFCLSTNDKEHSTLELEELLEIDPLNIQAYNILGRIYIKQEKIDIALDLLETAQKLGAKDVLLSEMLASVYLEKGRLNEAINFYEELPKEKKNLRMLGELYQRINNHEKSAEKFYEMYKIDPEVAIEAQNKLEELLLKNLKSIKIREFLIDIYAKSMKPDIAVSKLEEIIKISPDNTDKVIDKLKDLLKNYPQHPSATLTLAAALSSKGNYSEAIEEYYKLIKEKPEFIDKAIESCKDIIKKYPDQFLARQFIIENLMQNESFEESKNEIKSLLEIYPQAADWIIEKTKELSKKNIYARESLAYAYLAKHDFFNANLESEKILSSDPQNISALILTSEILMNQNLSRKALEILRKALGKSPYDPSIHKKYKEAYLKELSLQSEQLKKRISEDEWKMSLHFDLAKILIELGQKDEALRELQLASKDTQKASFVYLTLGNFYKNEGLYDQAIDSFKKGLQFSSIETTDNQKKIKFGLALVYEAYGNIRAAIKILEEIEQEDVDFQNVREKIRFLKNTSLASIQNKSLILAIKNPENMEILGMWGRETKKGTRPQTLTVSFGQNYNNSGLDFFFKGMYSAAEEEFSLAVQLDPNYLAGLNNLAATQIANKKHPEALSNLRRAFDLDPSSAIILNNLGLALFLNDLSSEALFTLNKAMEYNPELPFTLTNLADLLYKKGKVKEALDLYQKIKPYEFTYEIGKERLLCKQQPA